MRFSLRRRKWALTPRHSRRRPAYQPRLEALENRALPTTIHWINSSGGSWDIAANWDLGRVPGAGDDVVIDAPGKYTVTYSTGQTEIKSLTSAQAFSLTGGGLGVQGLVQVDGTFLISGAELREATVAAGTTVTGGTAQSTLTAVTLAGDLACASGAVFLQGSWRNQGVITVNGGFLGLGGTYTTAGMGNIQVHGGQVDLGGVLDNHGSTLTLTSGANVFWILAGTIQGGTLDMSANTLIAQGTAGRLTDVTVEGNVRVYESAYLTLEGAFRNRGVISVDAGGALAFTGTYTTAALGEIHNSQGMVYLGGTLDNAGSVLTLNNMTGSWGLVGTVNGGTLATADGKTLSVATRGGSLLPTLVGVTIDGEFDAPDQVQVQNGLTVNGILRVESSSFPGNVRFLGAQTVDGTGSIIFDGYGGRLTAAPENPVVLGPGLIVHTTMIGQLDNVINQGTILIENASANLTISGDGWRNEGQLRLSAGVLTLDGTRTLADLGNWQRTGGDLAIKGTLLNQGNTLALSAATGSLRLAGGRVVGGTITGRDGATVILTPFTIGTLVDVTLQTDVTIPSGMELVLAGAWRNQALLTLNGGDLVVSDTFSQAALGSFHRTGGIMEVHGTVANYGQTITLDDTTGPLLLHGGTIAGGTVATTGSAQLYVTDANNQLAGVTVKGNLALSPAPYYYSPTALTVTGGLTLQGTLTVDYPNVLAEVAFPGSQTLGGTGVVVLGHNGSLGGMGGVVTLGPGITARGQGTLHDFLNQGTLALDQPADSLSLSGNSWRNAGVIRMANGTLNLGGTFHIADLGNLQRSGGTVNLTGNLLNQGTTLQLTAATGSWNLLGGTVTGGTVATDPGTALLPSNRGGTLNGVRLQTDLVIGAGTSLSLAGPWTNRGGVTLSGGGLDLGGTFTWDALGTFHRSGGTLRVTGTVVNAGRTVTVDAATGPWELAGGTIDGGTVTTTGGLTLTATSGWLVDGVTVNGQVAGSVLAAGGLTLNGILQGAISFQGSQTVGGTGTITLGTGSNSGGVYGQAGAPVTIGPHVTVNGWGSISNFLNLGTIVSDRPGQGLFLGGDWHNNGVIHLTAGSLGLAGTFRTADTTNILRDPGTTVMVTGTLDNRGNTLVIDQTAGPWTLFGGTITGGTVAAAGGTGLVISTGATLDGVTLDADVTVTGSGFLNLLGAWSNHGRLTLNSGGLKLGGTFTTAALGDFHSAGGTVYVSGTLDNTGRTLNVGGPAGSWQLSGGAIVGGTVSVAPGAALVVSSTFLGPNLLQGVTVNGDVQVPRANLLVSGGLTLNGTLTVGVNAGASDFSDVIFSGSQAVSGSGTIRVAVDGLYHDALQGMGGRVTFGPDITIRVTNGRLDNFINQGTLVTDATTKALDLAGVWQNAGTLRQDGGSLQLDGTFTLDDLGDYRHSGGGVILGGTLDNTGRTFSLDFFPDFSMVNGTIHGGVVTPAAGFDTLRGGGTLDGATLTGALTLAGPFTLSGNWTNSGTLTLAANGTLNLGGSWSLDALGRFRNDGGTVRLVGTLDLESRTLALNHHTGSWVLAGGTILGGKLTTTRQTRFIIPANAQTRLDHVTLDGTLEVQSPGESFRNPGLIVTNGLTVNGTLLVNGPILFDGPQTLGGNGTVSVQSYHLGQTTLSATGGVVTFGPDLTLGVAQGNVANFSNQGTIVITGGPLSFLALEGTGWHNGGTIQVVAGTLALRGTFAGGDLGNIRNLGGVVDLQGTLTNTALVLNNTTGSWELDGGTITGGTVSAAGGARLLITANGGTLNGVTLNTDLDVLGGARLTLGSGCVNRGTLTLRDGTLNLGGHLRTADLGDLRFLTGSVIFSGQLDNPGGTLLLQGSAVTWHLVGGVLNGGTVTVVGSPLLVESSTQLAGLESVTLNGDLTVLNTSVIGYGFTLNGTMTLGQMGGYGAYLGSLDGAATVLFRGTDAARTALTVQSSSTLTYGPNVVIDAGAGCIGFCPPWSDANATILVVNRGMIVATGAGQTLTVRGTDLANFGTWQARGAGVLALELLGTTGNLVNAGVVRVDADSAVTANTTLTQVAGQTILAGGVLAAPLVALEGGVLMGMGTLTGDLLNDAVVQVGFAGVTGILEVQGNYTQGASGTLVVQIGGREAGTGYDVLAVDGTATLDGTLEIQVLDGFFVEAGDTFTILTAGARAGTFATILGLYPDGDVYFEPQYDANGLTLVGVPYGASPDGRVRGAVPAS